MVNNRSKKQETKAMKTERENTENWLKIPPNMENQRPLDWVRGVFQLMEGWLIMCLPCRLTNEGEEQDGELSNIMG